MIGAEVFVVRAIAGLVQVQERYHKAGAAAHAADAARCLNVFGCRLGLALDDHQAEPGDIKTDRDHVGGKRHINAVVVRVAICLTYGAGEPLLGLRDIVGRDARRQFQRQAQGAIGKWRIGRSHAASLVAVVRDMLADFILDNPARSAEFPERIEVGHHGQIGIRRIAGACCGRRAESLGAGKERLQRAQEQQFGAAALACHAEIEARRLLRRRHRMGEKAVAAVDARRREYRGALAVKQAADLALCAPDGRCRGDDLGAKAVLAPAARREQVDRRLVEAGDCPQRPGNQVQFILDDEIGRVEMVTVAERPALPRFGRAVEAPLGIVAIDVAEEGATLPNPRQRRKLV